MPILTEALTSHYRGECLLVNLSKRVGGPGPSYIRFQIFPTEIASEDGANWEQQDTMGGVKPLMYANRNPQQITIDELWLDRTETNESVTPDIEDLRSLMREAIYGARTHPPLLLFACGDWKQKCVLQSLSVKRQFFSKDGIPLRAQVSLTLLEVQEVERPARSMNTNRIPSRRRGPNLDE